MAHDRQLAESSSDMSVASRQSKTSQEVAQDWLIVYAKVYREEVQEELVLAYLEAFKDLKPELLHQAFLRAMKRSKFRPTPAEVRESYDVTAAERNIGNRPEYLDEQPLSPEEREAAIAECSAELRKKLGLTI